MRFPISVTNVIHCTKMLMPLSMTQENLSRILSQEVLKNEEVEKELESLLKDRWLLEKFLSSKPVEDLKEPALDKHRRELWAKYAVHPRETKEIALKELEGSLKGRAVDLGSGNGDFSIDAIKRGWEVTAVDSSSAALEILKKRVEEEDLPQEQKARFSCAHQKIEDFTFPDSVRLIYANDSLPYVSPKHVQDVIKRVHFALEKDGVFIGNFFTAPQTKEAEENSRRRGTWFANKPMMQTLLSDFVIKHLSVKGSGNLLEADIEFVASKF